MNSNNQNGAPQATNSPATTTSAETGKTLIGGCLKLRQWDNDTPQQRKRFEKEQRAELQRAPSAVVDAPPEVVLVPTLLLPLAARRQKPMKNNFLKASGFIELREKEREARNHLFKK